ncbi:KTSC domain-containing protein [Burkholderia metallica]|uniref:KTSC domain-containing protein n=1 Tax=Burkholderia metallica TaxID=488729 RepID=UPI001CF35EA5|nr:KTSC domain-containing protein [Burkholderia metallica]MCA8017773.1 KTSC domain-containing protein [Burkholderia metallica]
MKTTQIAMTPVDSSQIHSIGYDAATQTLAVRFKDRASGAPTSLYHYRHVTQANFDAFRNAESIGSHFYKHIKPHQDRFPYTRIESHPTKSKEHA